MDDREDKEVAAERTTPDAGDGKDVTAIQTKCEPQPPGESPAPGKRRPEWPRLNSAWGNLLGRLAAKSRLMGGADSMLNSKLRRTHPTSKPRIITILHVSTANLLQILHLPMSTLLPMVPRVTWRGLEGVHL